MKRELLALSLALFLAGPAMADDKHKTDDKHKHEHKDDDSKSVKIKVEDLPAKVAAGFKKDFPNATITEVEKETYKDGTVHYEIEYKDADGKEHEVEYNTDGEKLPDH